MNDLERKKSDLEDLQSVFDGTGIGEALKDGVFWLDFYDDEIQTAFQQANDAYDLIVTKYRDLLVELGEV